MIQAIRIAKQEHMPRAFIDLETDRFESHAASLPDPYALKKVHADKFAAARLSRLFPDSPKVSPGIGW